MAVDNLKAVTVQLNRIARDMPAEGVALVHKKVHFDLVRAVSMKTPRDTGRAMGGWQSSVHQTTDNVVDTTGSEAEQVARVMSMAETALRGLAPYVVTHIYNNVHYVKYLEDGSSQKAPAGMARLSVEELKNHLSTQ